MSDIQIKVKKWIELVQSEQLEDVITDIQTTGITEPDESLNKNLFKLLLYVAHTADKCRQNVTIGRRIYELTHLLCTNLTHIPDSIKFISSVFHISRCLLSFCLYEEAAKICLCLTPGRLISSATVVSDVLAQIAHLWRNAVNRVLQDMHTKSLSYLEIRTVLEYELEILQITYKNYTKYLLLRVDTYLSKFAATNKESFDSFCTYVIKYLRQKKLSLNEEEKYTIYCHMLHIIDQVICKNITQNCIESAMKVLSEIWDYFEGILIENEECYQCFHIFKCICTLIIRPVEQLTSNHSKTMKSYVNQYRKITKMHGYTGAVKWTALTVAQILEPLFTYWEKCLEKGKQHFLDTGIFSETMDLVVHTSIIFTKLTASKCKSCNDKDCAVRRDIYNAVIIKTRCINLVSKLPAKDLPQDMCVLARQCLEENIAFIHEMKECNCKCWTHLWYSCGTLLYNMGITSESFYEESSCFFSLLCSSIIQFEGVHSKSLYLHFQNPISSTLHRLSVVHYNHGMYREAMTASALNGLLSYDDGNTKAFRMWANIKSKSSNSKTIMKLTMLKCLEEDKEKIEEIGLYLNMSQYNLVRMCLREINGLQEAKVDLSGAIEAAIDELKALKANSAQLGTAVMSLGYHLLHFEQSDCSLEYVIRTITDIKRNNSNAVPASYLEANLEFYTFLNQLCKMNKQTQIEMESTKFALHAPRFSEPRETETQDVVPAYRKINVKEDSHLMLQLRRSLDRWAVCLKHNIKTIIKDWEPKLILHTLIIAGEYARLYRYEDCEKSAWMLAYKLASELQDYRAIIYVTGRSISLRQIDYKWIATAEEHAASFKDSDNEDLIYAIAVFWISLSDFYFECKRYDEARNLLDAARSLPGISFLRNISVYLLSLDTILRNSHSYKPDIDHRQYTLYIVDSLYTMVNLSDLLSVKKWRSQDKHLFGYDVLFSSSVNLSLRMNSLLSFREITAHLIQRLKNAQAIGATMRVAELLKSLCFIDLSRSQLDDCEVKLQGLEHILNIETFQLSMNAKVTQNSAVTPTRPIDPIRDVPQNDTSPVLRRRLFGLPGFLQHTECNCYTCQNVSYQYLVFASTYIRGQLYTLQNHVAAALEHFQGASKIKQKLLRSSKSRDLVKGNAKYRSWQDRFFVIDYVLFLLDFCFFLKKDVPSMEQKMCDVARVAIDVCEEYGLESHPICTSIDELLLDIRFQRIFNDQYYKEFTVPDVNEIDIRKYVQEPEIDQSVCITPVVSNVASKKLRSLRRNRTPPFVHLTKINANDDEGYLPASPPVSARHKKQKSRKNLVRRKIFEDESPGNDSLSDGAASTPEKSKEKTSDPKNSLNDVAIKGTPLVPNTSECLYKLTGDSNESVTNESLSKVIGKVKDLQINSSVQHTGRRIRSSKRLTANDYNVKVKQAVELLKDMIIEEKPNHSNDIPQENSVETSNAVLSVKTDTLPRTSRRKQEFAVSKAKLVRKSTSTENSSIDESNTVRRTRSRSTKQTITDKETEVVEIRHRKSKERQS